MIDTKIKTRPYSLEFQNSTSLLEVLFTIKTTQNQQLNSLIIISLWYSSPIILTLFQKKVKCFL